ncbi:MAG: DUF4118 domain-containing protein [Eubacteriales bacterium]|nr:DUF4118 domain-containing protein [Eubacteriales bacterium]
MRLIGPGRYGLCLLKALLIMIASTLSSLLVSALGVGKESIIMVFLLGVIFTTVLTRNISCGILSSIAGLMLFNYLFTEPRFTFVITSSNDIIQLLFFLITAVVSGVITSRLQQQMDLAAKNARTAQILYQIASGFLSVSGKENMVALAIRTVREQAGFGCGIVLEPSQERYGIIATSLNPSGPVYAIRSSVGQLGRLQLYGAASVDSQTALIVQAVAAQLGSALDREQLRQEQENIRLAMEREKLRATLLRAVAHDLRSPLTALSGAGSLLADGYEQLSDSERRKLASDISEEILWLSSLVDNILQMTRINEANLVVQKTAEVVDDVVSEAVQHMERFLRERPFTVSLPDEVTMVQMDGKLIVRVLVNLLENAVRHTPPGSAIDLTARCRDNNLEIAVSDCGPGIDPSIRQTLFDRFVTLDQGITDGKRGIGLGLAICKAIVVAHGGAIRVEPNLPHGSRFVFTLPKEAEA